MSTPLPHTPSEPELVEPEATVTTVNHQNRHSRNSLGHAVARKNQERSTQGNGTNIAIIAEKVTVNNHFNF